MSDPSLNLAKVIYRGGANDVNGSDGSYRGINIVSGGGTVQWGDGTHNRFFLPSAPTARHRRHDCRRRPRPPDSCRPVVLGGTLTLNFTGTYASAQKFVLIDAVAGISGTFGSIVSKGASVIGGQNELSGRREIGAPLTSH